MTPGDELAGKVALVPVSARHVVRESVRSLAAGGATVMINARTSRAEAEQTLATIRSAGGKAALHIADVTDARAVAAMVDAAVLEFGRLDFLVNNAAVRVETPFAEISFEEWRRVLSTVLDGAFLCAQRCLPKPTLAGR